MLHASSILTPQEYILQKKSVLDQLLSLMLSGSREGSAEIIEMSLSERR